MSHRVARLDVLSGRALIWGVGTVLVGGLLASGAIRPPSTLLVASASALLLVLAVMVTAKNERPLRLPPLALPPLVLAVLCVAQLVPLPPWLRARLCPEAERVARLALAGLEGATWRAATVDVAATLNDAARLFGLVALSVAMDAFDRRYRRRLRLVLAVALAALVAVPALHALGVPLPHWILAPSSEARRMFSLVNPNHAAAAIAMLLPTVLVLGARETGGLRVLFIGLAVAANFALVASASRAGVTLGVLAQMATLLVLTRRRDVWGRRRLVAVGAAGLLLAFAIVGSRFADRLQPESQQFYRLPIWRAALAIVHDHLWTGVGHGAFSLVIPRYIESGGYWRYGFVENQYLQLIVDVGVVGALLMGAAAIAAVRRARAGVAANSLGAQAAMIGLAVVLLHNAVDFSWAGAGVGGAALALGALAFPSSGGRLTRPALIAVIALPLAFAALAATPLGRTVDEEAARLIAEAPRDEAAFVAAFRRHPSDGYLADLAAAAQLKTGNPSAWSWLDRALLLNPRDSLAHSLAARALAAAGFRDQAAIEISAALANANHRDHKALFDQAWALFSGDADVDRLVTAFSGDLKLQHTGLERLAAERRWPATLRLAERVLEEQPDDVEALRRLVQAKRELGDRQSLADDVRRLVALDRSETTAVIAASVLADEKDFSAAQRLLDEAAARHPGSIELATARARLLVERGELPQARVILENALARAVGIPEKVTLQIALAQIEERDGNPHRAALLRSAAQRLQR